MFGVLLYGIPKLYDIVFPKKASIAVLQFINSQHQINNTDAFDALPILLAEDFSRCEHLTVIAPSSALLYPPDPAHLQKITSLLPSSYLVMISVQENREGCTLQIRLLIPDQQKIVLVGSVEGRISTLSEMRKNIVQKVTDAMEIRTKLPEIAQISDVDAFEKYLQAIHLLQISSGMEMDSAKGLLFTSVQIDPSFGLAYGTLADIKLQMFSETNDSQYLQSASEYAQRALRYSPNIALAHKVFAICARLQQNYNAALSSITQSETLLPQDPECYRELALLSIIAGKYDDASIVRFQCNSVRSDKPEIIFHDCLSPANESRILCRRKFL